MKTLCGVVFWVLAILPIWAESSLVRNGDLTTTELQKLLGIQSFRVQVPKEFGDFYILRLELYEGKERKMRVAGGGRVPDGRELVLALQENEEGVSVTEINEYGAFPVSIPAVHLKDLKGYDYSRGLTPEKSPEGQLVVYRREYFRAEKARDGKSFSTTNESNELLAHYVIYLGMRQEGAKEAAKEE